jgi:hypothetical protein
MSTFKNLIALLALCAELANCAPPLPGVPSTASTSYDWYNGHFTYAWRRILRSGCAAWIATENWADVQLVAGSRCDVQGEETRLDGQGISYLSVSDFLIFHGYWPWTEDEYSHLIEYDSRGMTSRILPCPHSLSAEQLSELRALSRDALGAATTDAERRVMARVSERLAATNGMTLASGQEGCTDLPPDWYRRSFPRHDPWTRRH